jgi:hypothetical protein
MSSRQTKNDEEPIGEHPLDMLAIRFLLALDRITLANFVNHAGTECPIFHPASKDNAD